MTIPSAKDLGLTPIDNSVNSSVKQITGSNIPSAQNLGLGGKDGSTQQLSPIQKIGKTVADYAPLGGGILGGIGGTFLVPGGGTALGAMAGTAGGYALDDTLKSLLGIKDQQQSQTSLQKLGQAGEDIATAGTLGYGAGSLYGAIPSVHTADLQDAAYGGSAKASAAIDNMPDEDRIVPADQLASFMKESPPPEADNPVDPVQGKDVQDAWNAQVGRIKNMGNFDLSEMQDQKQKLDKLYPPDKTYTDPIAIVGQHLSDFYRGILDNVSDEYVKYNASSAKAFAQLGQGGGFGQYFLKRLAATGLITALRTLI